MSAITTHVLDLAHGRPAAGVHVRLTRHAPGKGWVELAFGVTNDDGRLADLLPQGPIETGHYRLTFETGAYFEKMGEKTFYPGVFVAFEVLDGAQHYHVPLLLSPFGYSTYRGS